MGDDAVNVCGTPLISEKREAEQEKRRKEMYDRWIQKRDAGNMRAKLAWQNMTEEERENAREESERRRRAMLPVYHWCIPGSRG
jgi:hypothetical protein